MVRCLVKNKDLIGIEKERMVHYIYVTFVLFYKGEAKYEKNPIT